MKQQIPSPSQLRNLKISYKEIVSKWPEGEGFCEVCIEKKGLDNNELFSCKLCEGLVHQNCYGGDLLLQREDRVKHSQEGKISGKQMVEVITKIKGNNNIEAQCFYFQYALKDWYCERCYFLSQEFLEQNQLQDKSTFPRCHFCPELKGILKLLTIYQTGRQIWSHIGCIKVINSISFLDNTFSLIVEKYKPQRLSEDCDICSLKYGTCGFCQKEGCKFSFHFSCAKRRGLIQNRLLTQTLVEATESLLSDQPSRVVFCEYHIYQLNYLNMPEDHRIKDFVSGMNQQRKAYDQQGTSASSLYSIDQRKTDEITRKELIKKFKLFAQVQGSEKKIVVNMKRKRKEIGIKPFMSESKQEFNFGEMENELEERIQGSLLDSEDNWARVQSVMNNYDFRERDYELQNLCPLVLLKEFQQNREDFENINQIGSQEICNIEINKINHHNEQEYQEQNQLLSQQLQEEEKDIIAEKEQNFSQQIQVQDAIKEEKLGGEEEKECQQDNKNIENLTEQEKEIISDLETGEGYNHLIELKNDQIPLSLQQINQGVDIALQQTEEAQQNSQIKIQIELPKVVEEGLQLEDKNYQISEIYANSEALSSQNENSQKYQNDENSCKLENSQYSEQQQQQSKPTFIDDENSHALNILKKKKMRIQFIKEFIKMNQDKLVGSESLYILNPEAMSVIRIHQMLTILQWKKEIAHYFIRSECLNPIKRELQIVRSSNCDLIRLWKQNNLPAVINSKKLFDLFRKIFLVKIYDGHTNSSWEASLSQ